MPRAYTATTLATAGVLDTAFSQDGTLLYASVGGHAIDAYDVASGDRMTHWRINGHVAALSASDDGHYLLAAGQADGKALVVRIDTQTGESERFKLGSGSILDVQAIDDHRALLTGSNGLGTIDFDTGRFTALSNPYVSGGSELVDSGRYTLAAQRGVSDGPLALYDVRKDAVVAAGDDYQDGASSGFNWGQVAISAKAGLVAQFSYYQTVNIYDLDLTIVRTLDVGGPSGGLAFDPTGRHLFAFSVDSGVITQYSTEDWHVERQVSVSASSWTNSVTYGDQLLVSPDGHHLALTNTDAGILTLVDLKPSATSAAADLSVGAHAFGADAVPVHHDFAHDAVVAHLVALV